MLPNMPRVHRLITAEILGHARAVGCTGRTGDDSRRPPDKSIDMCIENRRKVAAISRRKVIGICFASATGMVLVPTVGRAQSCPPGYVVVGGGGAYGCAPISNGGNSTPRPREDEGVQSIRYTPPEKSATFVAIAWHPNANDVWAIWNNWSREGATRRALAACKSVMGEGCTIAGSTENGALVVARDENGWVSRVGHGVSREIARLELKQVCKDEGKDCRISQGWLAEPVPTFLRDTDPSQTYFPTKEVVQNTYTYIAWPTANSPNWKDKSWITSGFGSRDMKDRVLAQCKTDSGVECEIGQTAINGVVVAYQFGPEAGFRSAATTNEAEAAIQAKCAENQMICVIGKSYDSRTRRFAIIEDRATN